MKMHKSCFASNLALLLPVAVITVINLISLSTIKAEWLYETESGLFYFWRYGFFTLLGFVGGVLLYLITIALTEKRPIDYKPRQKWLIIIPTVLFWLAAVADYANQLIKNDVLAAWLEPQSLAEREGWLILQNRAMHQSAKLFGSTDAGYLANDLDRSMLNYVNGSLGWIAFAIAAAAMLILLTVMLKKVIICDQSVQKYIAAVIFIYFAVNSVWNTLEMFNILPYSALHMPFMSYDKIALVIDMYLLELFAGCVCGREKPIDLFTNRAK